MGVEALVVRLLVVILAAAVAGRVSGYWCVARSNAGDSALQAGLDYACSAGADCAPIEATGLCYLPNTLQAHASYAFNSLYQRRNMAAGSCDFSGTSILAKTDPSYGSCVYPPNPSAAGLLTTANTSSPTTQATTTTDGGSGTSGPTIPTTTNDATPSMRSHVATLVSFIAILLVLAA